MAIISKRVIKKNSRNSRNRKTSQNKIRNRNLNKNILKGGGSEDGNKITFKTNCNNELAGDNPYNITEILDQPKKLDCTPLIDKIGIDKKGFGKNIRDIFNTGDNYRTRDGKPNNIFLGKGSYKETWKVNENIALSITCFNVNDQKYKNVKDELKGFYFQSLFSKPIEDGGFGIQGIPLVYDFGKYEYEGNKNFRKEGVYGFMAKGGLNLLGFTKEFQIEKETSIKIIFNLLLILYQIHKKEYIHYDIKPENILKVNNEEDDPEIQLIDFGFTDRENDFLYKGSPVHMNPYKNNPKTNKYAMDIWSVGITLLDILKFDLIDQKYFSSKSILLNLRRQDIGSIPTAYCYTKIKNDYDNNLKEFLKHCCMNDSSEFRMKNNGEFTKEAIRLLIIFMVSYEGNIFQDFLTKKKEEIKDNPNLEDIYSLFNKDFPNL